MAKLENSFDVEKLHQSPRLNLKKYKSVQTRSSQDSKLTVVAAISGGGQRAGNFGVGVLMALEKFTRCKKTDNVLSIGTLFSRGSTLLLLVITYIARVR